VVVVVATVRHRGPIASLGTVVDGRRSHRPLMSAVATSRHIVRLLVAALTAWTLMQRHQMSPAASKTLCLTPSTTMTTLLLLFGTRCMCGGVVMPIAAAQERLLVLWPRGA
jgi:hypothetical protein